MGVCPVKVTYTVETISEKELRDMKKMWKKTVLCGFFYALILEHLFGRFINYVTKVPTTAELPQIFPFAEFSFSETQKKSRALNPAFLLTLRLDIRASHPWRYEEYWEP